MLAVPSPYPQFRFPPGVHWIQMPEAHAGDMLLTLVANNPRVQLFDRRAMAMRDVCLAIKGLDPHEDAGAVVLDGEYPHWVFTPNPDGYTQRAGRDATLLEDFIQGFHTTKVMPIMLVSPLRPTKPGNFGKGSALASHIEFRLEATGWCFTLHEDNTDWKSSSSLNVPE